jgi:hypothetical protein
MIYNDPDNAYFETNTVFVCKTETPPKPHKTRAFEVNSRLRKPLFLFTCIVTGRYTRRLAARSSMILHTPLAAKKAIVKRFGLEIYYDTL